MEGKMEQGNKKQLITTLAVLIVIVVIVGGVVLASKKDNTSNSDSVAPEQTMSKNTPSENTNTSSNTNAAYKDGSYTSKGSYMSPGGNEDITIKVTLKNGVVTDTSAVSGAHEAEGRQFQSQFISGYKDKVVGKNIDEISLSHVSGSSLTSQGFNDALDKIKDQATS
jgi:uncharacterized protein with FMN-binding domain